MLQGGHRNVSPEPTQRGKTAGSFVGNLIHIEKNSVGFF